MSALLLIFVLVVLIVVHELGHFLVAKLFNVRVDEFGIGYPPRAFVLKEKGETMYTLNWLPFGGFVRIFGENKTAVQPRDRNRAFAHKPWTVQIYILAAGVVGNIVLAWVLFAGAYMLGVPSVVTEEDAGADAQLVVQYVFPDTPAYAANLKPGDVITSVHTSKDALQAVVPSGFLKFISDNPGRNITLSYERDGVSESATLVPSHGILLDAPENPAIGVSLALITNTHVSFGSALYKGAMQTMRGLFAVAAGLAAFFGSALIGSADWASVSGPVGIAGLLSDASAISVAYLLAFTAFISLNLAVINLIPIPALDGGRILFVLLERIRGSEISPKITNIINIAGFAFIALLMLVVTYNDIVRFFVG